MFRKLANRITSAVSGDSTPSSRGPSDLQALISMGFDASEAQNALNASGGNVDRAAELLLSQRSGQQRNNISVLSEDEQLQQAMQASLAASSVPQRSAATSRAAKAAVNRANGRTASVTLAKTHPDVKLVPKFTALPTEDQVLRSVQRFNGHAGAVDTIYKALRMVKDHPREAKYRTIDTATVGYQRSVANAPGATDFWRVMGYQQRGTKLVLPSGSDPALLFLGISALEETKKTEEYITSKAILVLDKEVAAMQSLSDSSTEEAICRSEYMKMLPTEPPVGRGAILHVHLGKIHKITRRFDGDDTLQDVLHWLGASHGKALIDKLESGEWSLVDALRRESSAFDVKSGHLTLQYLGCWPSGKLQVLPSSTVTSVHNTSSRGLGAA